MTREAERSGPAVISASVVKPPLARRAELGAFVAASSPIVREPQPNRRTSSRIHPVTSVVVAGVVGTVLAISAPLEHQCAATFEVKSFSSAARDDEVRAALAQHIARLGTSNPGIGPITRRWWIDAPAAGMLRLGLTTTDRRNGVEAATAAARDFLTIYQEQKKEFRRTPSEAERVYSELVFQLQERVTEAQTQFDSATASLPPADPRIDRDALVQRWRGLRTDFAASRAQLAEAAAGVNRLRIDSQPTRAIVSADDRRHAMESDSALQQDLKELEVRLAELKLHLLNVWQQSAGRLEQLRTAMDELSQTASSSETGRLAAGILAAIQGLARETDAYRQTLLAFTEVWTGEFTNLQRMNVDPAGGELLDRYQRVRTLLSDFLFTATQELTAIRFNLNLLGEQTSDTARHYVLHSNLTRAFQAAQAAHHRFEFAAGAIDTPDNFRLDAALRSARGLRRRALEGIQRIEQRLQEEAIESARRQHAAALVAAQQAVEQTRATSEETIEQLFAVQDGLIHAVGLTEEFFRAVLRAELTANRLQTAQDDLSRASKQLRELSSERESTSADVGIKLVSCGVIDSDIVLAQRLRLGGIGFGLTLVTVLLGQWWITRRT